MSDESSTDKWVKKNWATKPDSLRHSKLSKMYLVEEKIVKRNRDLLNTQEAKELLDKADKYCSALVVLDDIVTDKRPRFMSRLRQTLNPFYNLNEFASKESYLQYLKQVYGFLISPSESPPSRALKIFYKRQAETWEPSLEDAKTLLKQFYLETQLIKNLSDDEWANVQNSKNPEAAIFKLLHGIKFSPKFKTFISSIPWRISQEPYGAPGLDLSFWRTPGPDLAKKPMAADSDFINRLVKSSIDNEAQREVYDENKDESYKLYNSKQILMQIKKNGKAIIDSYVGISKREADFILHQRTIIWKNPSFGKYKKASFKDRLRLFRPPKYLATIHERILPLEIPFLSLMRFEGIGSKDQT